MTSSRVERRDTCKYLIQKHSTLVVSYVTLPICHHAAANMTHESQWSICLGFQVPCVDLFMSYRVLNVMVAAVHCAAEGGACAGHALSL